MSQHTWPEVAHYYAYSGIMGKLNWGPNSINLPLDSPQDAALIHDRLDHIRSKQITFTPILRALKDMTEEEARELFAIVGQPIHNARLDEIVADYGIRKRTIPEYVVEYVVECSFKLSISTVIQHWLIQRGFDVFGLIASGQAIRKEAGV